MCRPHGKIITIFRHSRRNACEQQLQLGNIALLHSRSSVLFRIAPPERCKCLSLLYYSIINRRACAIRNDKKEAVEKLRFSDNLCFDFAKHGRPKVPMRKLSPSQSQKTEVHAPGFLEFALQILFHACCRTEAKHFGGFQYVKLKNIS